MNKEGYYFFVNDCYVSVNYLFQFVKNTFLKAIRNGINL